MLDAATILASVIFGWLLGYRLRDIQDKVEELDAKVKARDTQSSQVPDDVAPKSTIIDPDDIAQRLRWEHAERQRLLNGDK